MKFNEQPPVAPPPPLTQQQQQQYQQYLEQMSSILGGTDPLDAYTFDPIRQINNIFPTEQSFSNADKIMLKLKHKIYVMEGDLKDLQSPSQIVQAQSDLQEAKSEIKKLYADIKEIKEKAGFAEHTVQGITRDIKSLDMAKKNLVSTMTVLRRLQMLVTAVQQLRDLFKEKNYKALASILQAVKELSEQFSKFKSVPQVVELCSSANLLIAELKQDVVKNFHDSFTSQGVLTANAGQVLPNICLVIDVLEADVRSQLLEWYCDLNLSEYRSIFRPEDEVGNLDNIARRFAFLKRIIKNYDENQANMFPKSWEVSMLVCKRFCFYTRMDIVTCLSKNLVTDVKVFIKSIQMTQDFEMSLNRRFAKVNASSPVSETALEIPQIFNGSISNAFDAYMNIYIDAEDKALMVKLDKFRSTIQLTDEDLHTLVFSAFTDLFYYYRQTVVNMAKLSTGKPFLDLSKLLGKWLVNFCDVLGSKIPKDDRRSITSDDIKITCVVLNTADYCHNTTDQLAEKIKELIDPDLKETVDMTKESEMFLLLVTNAVQALVRLVNSSLTPALQSMSKIPWSTLQNVGDQSEYVTHISSTLTKTVKEMRNVIQNIKHFKWFCDKLVDSLVPNYVKAIYNCKPISEAGAEQMLLDSLAIKTVLLELPNIGSEEKSNPSSVYVKFVTKGMSKAETLLKVVLTPLDPPDSIIKNYVILNSDQYETEAKPTYTPQKVADLRDGFIKILELKGVKKVDQQQLLDLLMKRLPRYGNMPASLSIPTSSMQQSIPAPPPMPTALSSIASGLASISISSPASSSSPAPHTPQHSSQSSQQIKSNISEAGSKFNQNIKKFAAAMDIKSPWLKKDNSSSQNQTPK